MEVRYKPGDPLVVKLIGDLRIQTVRSAQSKLRKAFGDARRIHVDLALVDRVDAAGMQLLSFFHRLLSESGVVLRYERPSETLRAMFELYGVTPALLDAKHIDVSQEGTCE